MLRIKQAAYHRETIAIYVGCADDLENSSCGVDKLK